MQAAVCSLSAFSTMASRAALPSDPEFLLDLMHNLPVDSDSDDEFDGYLEPEDGPVVFRSAAELDDEAYTLRSQSLQDLTELEEASEEGLILQTESPLLAPPSLRCKGSTRAVLG